MSDPRGDEKANPDEQFASGRAQRQRDEYVKDGTPDRQQRYEHNSDRDKFFRNQTCQP